MSKKGVFTKTIFTIGFLFIAFLSQASIPVSAFLTYSAFNTPSKGPYLETYLSVIGNTVNFVKNTKGNFQGQVDISIAFTQNNEIKSASKYTLTSPEIADTSKNFPNFLDEHRYPLANGNYVMEISIADKNKTSEKPFSTKVNITINFPDKAVTVSDIQLLESYAKSASAGMLTKSGYDLVPYVSSFFPENISKLKFYAEIYNTKKIMGEGQRMIISYSIQAVQTNTKLNDYSSFSKQTTNDVNILLSEFDISDLPSGNYSLTIEVKDKDNKIQAVQILQFQRKNKLAALSFSDLKSIDVSKTFVSKYKSIDTLSEYIRSLRPISGSAEVQYSENQLKGKNLQQMQQYFYNFWKLRNALDPEQAWIDYNTEVIKVNREYGALHLKGYDSDRGRIYLQYGPPTVLGKYENEPNSYPFEIWQYNTLIDKSKESTLEHNRQSNRKFVFVSRDLSVNSYKLIHSNAIGERTDSRWKFAIFKLDANNQTSNLDDQSIPAAFGSNLEDIWNNPR